eukprot:305270-Chlamydomonas_euryale.AAC.3
MPQPWLEWACLIPPPKRVGAERVWACRHATPQSHRHSGGWLGGWGRCAMQRSSWTGAGAGGAGGSPRCAAGLSPDAPPV